jgi:hypothetical protein
MMPHSLRAPSADGALLAEPPLAGAGGMLAANAERLALWDHDFQGRRASRLRPMVRKQVLDKARSFLHLAGLDAPEPSGPPGAERLVVVGHQPELFHPGVWVKNFAAAAIAGQAGAVGLNLIVDNDVPKESSVRVPRLDGEALRVVRVAYDESRGESPYEDLAVADESRFGSFADRVRARLDGVVADPILDDFWPRALAARGVTDRLGLRFALARRGVEASWGAHNFEVPLSAACETEGFLWFASHLLAQLPRFQAVHNQALRVYRDTYGIRSRHHPVPALGRQGEWLEAPFWVWRAVQPRRRPLLVRQLARTMELRLEGEDEPFLEIPLGPDREACCAVEQLAALPARGVRLRTRALTTTMFARLLLGDLFLHGIGGAKYDELGDEVARGFFGLEPPPYMTLSMTLRLGLGADPEAPRRLEALQRTLRDLTYNPDRHLGGAATADAEAVRWAESKRAAIAAPVETRRQRRERFRSIRHCNEALQGHVSALRHRLTAERGRLAAAVARDAVARSREYALVLHSRHRFRDALSRNIPALPGLVASTV